MSRCRIDTMDGIHFVTVKLSQTYVLQVSIA